MSCHFIFGMIIYDEKEKETVEVLKEIFENQFLFQETSFSKLIEGAQYLSGIIILGFFVETG